MAQSDLSLQKLIDGLAGMTHCDYLRYKEEHGKAQYDAECGDASTDIESILSRNAPGTKQIATYVSEQILFTFSIISNNYLSIQLTDTGDANASERRNRTNTHRTNRIVTLSFVSMSSLPAWLISLASEEHPYTSQQEGFIALLSLLYVHSRQVREFERLKSDPLTKLLSREAIQRKIDAQATDADMLLCLIHCNDFQLINRKFGQSKGDEVLQEISLILGQHTRADDILSRFGGALFGVAAHSDDIEDGYLLASKLKTALEANPYLNSAIRLTFNFGVGIYSQHDAEHDNASPSSIIMNRSEKALRAAQSDESTSIMLWEIGKFDHDEQDFDYLGGIFSADNVSNYRNMLLLWDISSIIADEYEFEKLIFNVIQRLASTFEFEFAGLISPKQPDNNVFLSSNDIADISQVNALESDAQALLHALSEKSLSEQQVMEHIENEMCFLVLPMGINHDVSFFMYGNTQQFSLSRDTNQLFAGFARQIGKALRRNQLEDALNKNLAQQNAKLVEEVETLKTGLKSSTLIFQSDAMQQLMIQAQRAARTDTTVLITGESGTGKERLIHAVHSLGPRASAPLIIVDCGSIPETLIESELFGHAKGAFTGAQHEKTGKIKAADGGIIVLDEIGELPLSMQPKLLRFVQEKYITPIGSTKQLAVNVKIVAVTNRNLEAEVEAGRFRRDLFYRLNVITLHNIPLRDRVDDLPLLCQHFITQFSKRFDTPKKYIQSDTLSHMRQYTWPGNIRELENKLMQAFLLSQTDEITLEDLRLDAQHNMQSVALAIRSSTNTSESGRAISAQHTPPTEIAASPEDNQIESKLPNNTIVPITDSAESWLQTFSNAIQALVIEVNQSHAHYHLNIGEQIELYLFRECERVYKTNKEIATRLQLPISTARRKVNKALSAKLKVTLPASWTPVASLLDTLITSDIVVKEPLAAIKCVLVDKVLQENTCNMTRAAAQIGVSEPTLYKLKRQQ